MTREIKNAIKDYERYRNKFNHWNNRKKKKKKHIINDKFDKMNKLCDEGCQLWISKQARKNNINGLSSWNEVNNIIKYDSCHNNCIPNWYNDNNELVAVSSQEKADKYIDFIHRFDDLERNKLQNPEFDGIINKFKSERKEKMDVYGYHKEIKKLNEYI